MPENDEAARVDQSPDSAYDPLANAHAAKDPYDLDLDLLEPQSKHIKLNGKLYEVFPPKVKDLVRLSRLAGQLQDINNTNSVKTITDMIGVFQNIMPGLSEDNVDLSMSQLLALFGFVNNMVDPAENSALKTMGIEPTTEKKVPAV